VTYLSKLDSEKVGSSLQNTSFRPECFGHPVDGSEIPRPTIWDVENPANNGIFTIPTGAGYLPSTALVAKFPFFK